jgi:ubiquinone/menaquinone biosynthesis C-methylase UbiE
MRNTMPTATPAGSHSSTPSAPSPAFAGSIPRTYHDLLGPLIFEPYANDLAARVAALRPLRILETACGTGIVTRKLLAAIQANSAPAPTAELVATDISEPMLAIARQQVGPAANLTFQPVDACTLPFPDRSFDTLVCQYGFMFFPDKVQAMKEARRVLKPGARLLFNVWDSLDHNPIPSRAHDLMLARFPANPPMFLAEKPFGWSNRAEIERTVRAGGFTNATLETLSFPSQAPTAAEAARAWIEGTPLLPALAERGFPDPTQIREELTRTLARDFGDHPCRSTMQAVVVTAW